MDNLGSVGKTIVCILTTMEEVIANILHDHNYITDQETQCTRKFIDVPEILKPILHDHDYIRYIFNTETMKYTDLDWLDGERITETDGYVMYDTTEKAREIGVMEETLYSEAKLQDDVNMFQGNIQKILGSRTLDRKNKLNFSTNKSNQHPISRADSIGVSRPMCFEQINSDNVLNHTLNDNVIQMNNKTMESLYNTDILTNLTSIKTTNNVENQSILFADQTILNSNESVVMFDHPIKQEKDCDVYDPDTTVETLSTSILDEITSAVNIKIEECVSEWNDKNIDSSYMAEDIGRSEIKSNSYTVAEDWTTVAERFNSVQCTYCIERFETSEMKVKHEFICRLAPHLVVNMVKLNIFPEEGITKDFEVAYTNLILCEYCNEGFKTSELELKHEFVCKYARRPVIELRRAVEATRPKKRRINALPRELASCWSGIEEVWRNKKENTTKIEESRVQKKEAMDKKRLLFACVHCSFNSKYESSVKRHTSRWHKYSSPTEKDNGTDDEKILLACAHCSFKTEYKANLERHTFEHYKDDRAEVKKPINEKTWFACTHCKYKSEWKERVKCHTQNKHADFICYHCGYSFRDKNGLKSHLLLYREMKKEHRCRKCSFMAYCRPALRIHVKDKHKTKNECKKFQCPHCPSIFSQKHTVGNHILQKHPKFSDSVTQKIHKCDVCMFQTTFKVHLRDHILNHSNIKPYKCEMCKFKTKWKSMLNVHIVRCQARRTYANRRVEEKKPINEEAWSACTGFICYHCGYNFREKNTLKYHLLQHREMKKEYKCGKCSFIAYCKPALRIHVKDKHETKNECKKFQCPHCSSIFSHKYTVGDHILRKHPKFSDSVTQKIHKCNICMFQTASKSHFRNHMLKHSNIKALKCEICGYTTKWKCSLNRHIVKCHARRTT